MNLEVQRSFFNDHQARFSSETIRSYQISLRQFFSFCNKNYNEVRAADVRAWLASLEEKSLKPRSIHLKLSALKSFYNYCMEENMLKKDPTLTIQPPKIDDSLPRYLSKRQVALLQELTKGDRRDRALIETFYVTGVRVSELINIRLEDIKWDMRQIWIKGKGKKVRFVLFTNECEVRLKAYLHEREIQSDYLFCNRKGGALSRVFIEKKFTAFSDKLGFKIVPHMMRHTFATHLTEKNMDFSYIQELLGHSNINSTRVYTRLMDNARKKQYDRYR
ncbi:site-specific tyrosine recombinase/integron integrase [Ureibacillus chungkukjangi]|uniref:Integrase/recombinase XerC/integrase/recombinase XerD n=1 Tax=Ureibacillus chungkukjangi TaxID=1202712 RepID=A0A318TX29_9BACL|nr:site-specific tyrosine recombinase/integron integrase [Ureibacillus chungkukjangi]PYF07568.1 integrase/recombinase XerC/integrase/recombinase XerD [Ureibacillus chungkukjangi]